MTEIKTRKNENIRKTIKVDATGMALGRLSVKVAAILMGKNKVSYERHIDRGDFVAIENIRKIKFTGKKLEQKKYYNHSGYPGGLKTRQLKKEFPDRPEEILKKTVYNMLPKNKLRPDMMKRIKFVK